MTLVRVIEALLFSAQKPLSTKAIADLVQKARGADDFTPNEFAKVKEAEVAAALEQLKFEYIEQQRPFQVMERAEGWQFATEGAYAPYIEQLFPEPKPARLSAPAL